LAGNLSVIAVLKLIDGYTAPHHIDSDGVKERTIRIFDLLVKTGAETPQKQENATL